MKKYLVLKDATVLKAMEVIEKGAISVAFVVNKNAQLCGVISDGDIRRALLGGYPMHGQIKNILNKEYAYARQGDDYSKLFQTYGGYIKILPIVDEKKRVVDYIGYHRNAK